MKLLIIGATRGIGRNVLTQALDKGYEVTALIRSTSKFDFTDEHLRIVRGDILDSEAVARALEDCDAVCVTIGINPTLKAVSVFSEGTRNVIGAMTKSGVQKLVCITGIGAGDSKNHGGFFYDKIFRPFVLKTIYEDKDRQEEIVKNSGLQWVIVRPGFLTNGALSGQYRVLTDLKDITVGKISRADVADFILKEIEHPSYTHQTPSLTY